MRQQEVRFRFASDPPRVRLRELTGFDEQCVWDSSTATAVRLLDRVVESQGEPWRSAHLTASDRDLLLAAVYRSTFGHRIDSTSTCVGCNSLFDLSFTLDELVSAVDCAPAAPAVEALDDGVFRTRDGARFRLPTGEDEIAVDALPTDRRERALFDRCLIGEVGPITRQSIEQAIEEIAPVLDIDIDTACPECGASQAIRFNVQYYLLRTIELGRERLTREIHRIASAYGWSLAEILSLRRSERRMFAELIESDALRRKPA